MKRLTKAILAVMSAATVIWLIWAIHLNYTFSQSPIIYIEDPSIDLPALKPSPIVESAKVLLIAWFCAGFLIVRIEYG